MSARPDVVRTVAVAGAAMLMCAITAAMTASASTSDLAWLEGVGRAFVVAAPIGVGLYAQRRSPFERFGALLVMSGVAWFVASLSVSQDAVVHSVGRIAGWGVEVGVVYLVLAFPTGQLERVDRLLVGAMAALVAILYLPTALLVEAYPDPSVWTDCGDRCAGNALMVTAQQPAVVDDFIRPLREVLTVVIFGAAVVRLGDRVRRAGPVTARLLTPVYAVGILRMATVAMGLVSRGIGPDARLTVAFAWTSSLALPAIAIAFLIGVVRWRLFVAESMTRLAASLRAHPRPADLQDALAEAFDDPSLEVVYWLGNGHGRWTDISGRPIADDLPGPGRAMTEIGEEGVLVAAIVHDAALAQDRSFIDSAVAYATMTLDNNRLSIQTTALLSEARASRARIQAAADDERRRIEHDLHDGAQQRLVTLRIKLELAAERASGNGGADAELLRELGTEVEEALDEMRALARGIYPAPLAARGLVEALRSAALRSPVPTSVLAAGVERYPREVETAAYFCCLEAMQNTAKHAHGATATVIELSDNGSLQLEVRDDGEGFDTRLTAGGVGFTNMRDRLAAVGGQLAIDSSPGRGTRLTATIPLGAESNGAPH